MQRGTTCIVCGREIPYEFGRPPKVCSHECFLLWKRERYYKQRLLQRSSRISRADLEFAETVCECGCDVFAWTMEGVFCNRCGLQNALFSAESWVPPEFIPTPACRCREICRQGWAYQLWFYA